MAGGLGALTNMLGFTSSPAMGGMGLSSILGLLSGLVDYGNQQAAENLSRDAQTHAIGTAWERAANTYRQGREEAGNFRGNVDQLLGNWQSQSDQQLSQWYSDYVKRGGVSGQLAPQLNYLRDQTGIYAGNAEASAQGRANTLLDQARTDYTAGLTQGTNLWNQVSGEQKQIQSDLRGKYDDMLRGFQTQLDDLKSGRSEAKDLLNAGVAHQIAGQSGAIDSQKSQALAQFDASWVGPRDQRYQAQRNAIEQQFGAQSRDLRGQAVEKLNQLVADTEVKLQTNEASLMGQQDAARGQAYYGLSQAESEGLRTLGTTAGDVMGLVKGLNESYNSAATQTNASLNQVYTAGAQLRAGAESTITGYYDQALRTDEAARAQYMDLQRGLLDSAVTRRTQLESQYTDLLMGSLDRYNQFAQAGINMEYNQNFGTPLLSPAFTTFFNEMSQIRQFGLEHRQQEMQSAAINGSMGLAGAGMGLQALDSFSSFMPSLGGLGGSKGTASLFQGPGNMGGGTQIGTGGVSGGNTYYGATRTPGYM